MAVLELCPGKLCPNLFPYDRDIESHASPAAFDAVGGPTFLPPDVLGDFEGLLPSLFARSVVNRRPFFSGLGVLDVLELKFRGAASKGGEYGTLD